MNAPVKPQFRSPARQPTDPDEEVILTGGAPPPGASDNGKCRVFILDDHPLFRFGLRRLIDAQPDMTVCGEAQDAVEALDEAVNLKPDLITVDISLHQSMNGIEFVKNIRTHLQKARILVLSMHDETVYALRALRAGAQGYLMKQEVLARAIEAIRTVAAGGIFLSEPLRQQVLMNLADGKNGEASPIDSLSDRELEVLQLSGQGQTPREIATQLGISIKTVETHRMRIRQKLKLSNSAELMRFAIAWSGEAQGLKST
jgi:DNA-binding NarL/FixJ family response regulator